MGDRLATIDMGWKLGAAPLNMGQKLGAVQCFGLRPNGRIYVCKNCPIHRNSETWT